MENREIEVRFLEINKPDLTQKLQALGARDLGEELLDEVIFYDNENKWQGENKMVRIRKTSKGVFLAFKHHQTETVDGTEEVELMVDNFEKAKKFMESLGFVYAKRHQQKKRHKFLLNGTIIDFDTWPKVPTFVELEGESEADLQTLAAQLGLDWDKAIFASAKGVIEKNYGIPVTGLKYYTFDRIE